MFQVLTTTIVADSIRKAEEKTTEIQRLFETATRRKASNDNGRLLDAPLKAARKIAATTRSVSQGATSSRSPTPPQPTAAVSEPATPRVCTSCDPPEPPVPPQVANMPQYNNYSGRVKVMAFSPWYSLDELAAVIAAVRRINWSVKEQRQQALEQINNMNARAPYSKVVRFPEEAEYICENYGDWARKFQQLRASLSFQDYVKDNKATNGGQGYADSNDAQQAFNNSTTSIMDQLLREDGLFDRPRFESILRVQWE